MTLVVADRIQETTATTGTGTLTLGGAVSGFRAFSVVGDRNECFYCIDDGAGNWEVGRGTYTGSGTTLSRDLILASSNSGSAVSFGAGTKNVWVDAPAKLLTQAALAVANVLLYGAVGNGSADDHAAIQAAIDSGLPVYFPAATYAISTGLTAGNNGQSLSGPKGVILKKTAGVDALTVTGNDNEIRGITIDGNSQSGGSGLVIKGANNYVDGVESHHHSTGHGICLDGQSTTCAYNRIHACYSHDNGQIGISQNHVTDSIISDCYTYHNGYEGITIDNQSYRCLIDNCNVNANCQSGGVGGIGIDEGDLARITNCIIQATGSSLPGIKFQNNLGSMAGVNISGCVFVANGGPGIVISNNGGKTASAISVIGCRFQTNGSHSVTIDSGCNNCTVALCDLGSQTISDSGTGTILQYNQAY
jgi:hypothetical protein